MPSGFLIFISIALVLVFLAHLVVYKGIVGIFGLSSHLFLIKIFLIIFGLGFVAAQFLSSKYNNAFLRPFYTITASWYGFLFYLFLATVVYAILAAIFGSHQELISLIGKILLGLACLIGIYGLWNAEQISITRYDISIPNLPEVWKGKKAVWVSDIHLGEIHGENYSEKIVSIIEKENPDIVFIGGDLFDGVKVNEAKVVTPFSEIKAPLGIYFITGNHEEFGDKTHFINAIKNIGIKVLDNQMVNVEGLQIIGVDDSDSTDSNTFENILSSLNINKNEPSILLKHQPNLLDIAEKFGINVQISGHTHKAQIYPLSYIASAVYKGYSYGFKNYGPMQTYVSSGVGTWGPPLRVGSKSEILVFEFK